MSPRPDETLPLIFYRSTAMGSSPLRSAPVKPVLRPSGGRPRKPFMRRCGDNSQRIRSATQLIFVLITAWVGVQFYLWVRYYETSGESLRVSRPPGVEAWLPIAALMTLKDFLLTGHIPQLHPAGMFMLMAFLAISWIYRKAFCSWICPVGTFSEWLWKGGQATFGRTFSLPRWLDIPLRGLKYILFGLFAYVVVTMPVPAIREFLHTPYGLVADVKMLDFFRKMGETTTVVLAVLVILSVFVKNFWCRYLCPYGAMTGLVALFSPTRIRRDPVACLDCAKCTRACPAGLPVGTKLSIRSAECSACMTCVAVCPAVGALDLKTGLTSVRSVAVPAWALAAGVAIVFFGIVGYARATGHWHTDIPDAMLFELIPRAGEFGHPR